MLTTAEPEPTFLMYHTATLPEATVIGCKLENSLAIDYPALQIVVVSDGSTDATPAIIRSFAGQGVIAIEQPTRRGKSVAITGFSGLPYTGLLLCLKELGLTKDQVVPLNIGGKAARFESLLGNRVPAAILDPPYTTMAAKEGYRLLVDLAPLDVLRLSGCTDGASTIRPRSDRKRSTLAPDVGEIGIRESPELADPFRGSAKTGAANEVSQRGQGRGYWARRVSRESVPAPVREPGCR